MPSSGVHLYTILLDYAGGSYVSQVEALDERAALDAWLSKLGPDHIVGAASAEIAARFEADIDGAVALDGLTGAWCATSVGSQGLAVVNIVRTAT